MKHCSYSSVGQSVRLLTARSEVRPLLGATRLAQSVERRTFNPVVVGSSPTLGEHNPIYFLEIIIHDIYKYVIITYLY